MMCAWCLQGPWISTRYTALLRQRHLHFMGVLAAFGALLALCASASASIIVSSSCPTVLCSDAACHILTHLSTVHSACTGLMCCKC